MIPRRFLFCYWLWVTSALYLFCIYPYSHLILLIGATIFTTVLVIYNSSRIDMIVSIILWESFVLWVVYRKWSQNNVVKQYRLLPDVVLFAIYLIFLYMSNETFYSIYFDKVSTVQKNYKGSLFNYITRSI
jgi:hypothetical protein